MNRLRKWLIKKLGGVLPSDIKATDFINVVPVALKPIPLRCDVPIPYGRSTDDKTVIDWADHHADHPRQGSRKEFLHLQRLQISLEARKQERHRGYQKGNLVLEKVCRT